MGRFPQEVQRRSEGAGVRGEKGRLAEALSAGRRSSRQRKTVPPSDQDKPSSVRAVEVKRDESPPSPSDAASPDVTAARSDTRNAVCLCTDRNMLIPALFVADAVQSRQPDSSNRYDVIVFSQASE